MKIKRYLTKYGVKVAVIAVVAALAVVIGASVRNGIASSAKNGAVSLAMPVQKAVSAVAGWFESIYGYMYKYDQLVEDNNYLRAQLIEYQMQAADYQEALEENARLRELLNLQAKHQDFEFESAKIVSWDSSNYASAFTISKGSDSGIEAGDSVVTEYGALVGQITELGTTWATVRTVVDVGMDVGALVGENGYAGMIVGEFSLMQQGKTRMTYLSAGAQIFDGDEVVTSGKGGAFPPGLRIGTVEAVMAEAGGQTTYGIVEPACELDSLSQVFVIKDYRITE